MTLMKSITTVLKDEIRRRGLPQKKLAELAGIQRASLYRFVSGERDLWLKTADRLCQALGLELMAKRPTKPAKKGGR